MDQARSSLAKQATRNRYLLEERAKPVTDDGILVKTSGGLSDEWTFRRYKPEDMWAFQSLEQPEVPIPGLNPIDSFVRAKLKLEKIKPAPSAHFRDLVKRAYLDLCTDSLRLPMKFISFDWPGTKSSKSMGRFDR